MFKIFTYMFNTFKTKIKFYFAIIFDANKQRKNNILNKTLSNEQKTTTNNVKYLYYVVYESLF